MRARDIEQGFIVWTLMQSPRSLNHWNRSKNCWSSMNAEYMIFCPSADINLVLREIGVLKILIYLYFFHLLIHMSFTVDSEQDPRPHISLVWALGDISGALSEAVREHNRFIRSGPNLEPSQKQVFMCKFSGIRCKVGKKSYNVCRFYN